MSSIDIVNIQGKTTSKVELPKSIDQAKVRKGVIYQAVVKYLASMRQGTASVKERGAVSGGGKKPWKQKGTGRARAGSSRSPLWIGGGVTHGPVPRDFSYDIPQKVKKVALLETLILKIKEGNLHCIEDLKQPLNKTKEFVKILEDLKIEGKILAILDGSDATIERVSRNIAFFNIYRSQDVNAYNIIAHKKMLITKTGLNNLLKRIEL